MALALVACGESGDTASDSPAASSEVSSEASGALASKPWVTSILQGNLPADADVDAFVLKASTLASYYVGIEIGPGTNVNGQLVVTEAAADLCGMQAILELASKIEGIDYGQFFSKNTDMWAQVVPAEMLPNLILDAHPLNNLCVNVNAQMFDEFYATYGATEGNTMYLAPDSRLAMWGSGSNEAAGSKAS
jgi:predicted metalloendopeptidase